MNRYQVRAYDFSDGTRAREFSIDAPSATDALAIFQVRFRNRHTMTDPENPDGPMVPTLSDPFDVVCTKENV